MSNSKGQGTVEFLMTYGWAILAMVLTVYALASFGLLTPTTLMVDRCSSSSEFNCFDPIIFSNGSLTFAARYEGSGHIKDISNFELEIDGVYVPDFSCSLSSEPNSSAFVENSGVHDFPLFEGSTFYVLCKGIDQSFIASRGSKSRFAMDFNYGVRGRKVSFRSEVDAVATVLEP